MLETICMRYMFGCKSELAVEHRGGLGRCLVLRMVGDPEGSELSEVIATWLGGPDFALTNYHWARGVYRRLHELGRVSYTGGRTHDDRPIWSVKVS